MRVCGGQTFVSTDVRRGYTRACAMPGGAKGERNLKPIPECKWKCVCTMGAEQAGRGAVHSRS